MKVAFTTWNYEPEIKSGQYDLKSIMHEAHSMGFEAIEFMGYHFDSIQKDYLDSIKNLADNLGITISAIDVRNTHFMNGWADFKYDVAAIQFWLETANYLKVPVVGVFLGGFTESAKREKQLEQDIKGLSECAKVAESLGVKLAIENHRIYQTTPEIDPAGNELDDIMRAVREVNSKNLGTMPDTDNFFCDQFPSLTEEQVETNYEYFERMSECAFHVHYKIKAEQENAQCSVKRLMQILKSKKYNGDISFEYMKPIQGQNTDLLASAREKLQNEINGL